MMVAERVRNRKGMGLRAGLLTLALTMGAGFAAAPAMAQDQNAQNQPQRGVWVKLCDKTKDIKDPKKTKDFCFTFAEKRHPTTGQVLISTAVRKIDGQDKRELVVMVPSAMVIPAGLLVRVDENEPVKLQYQFCYAAGCTAEGEATDKIVEQLKSGKTLEALAVHMSGRAYRNGLPLNGFAQAMAGKPVDNKKFAQEQRRLMMQIRARQKELIKRARAEAAKKKAEQQKN